VSQEFEYRPLASPANWIGFKIAKTNSDWHSPNLEFGAFLVLHSVHALHETIDLPAQSLNESWFQNDRYFHATEKEALPPLACMPIYVITIGEGESEKVVYIGKTTSKSSRFMAGHKAMTRLHAPRYDGLKKRLYRCCVVLLSGRKNEIPLEWITPYPAAKEMLSTFENILIYNFQPELNTQLKNRAPVTTIGSIHIQNLTSTSDFLNDEFVWP
jgi:hypothetical protein